MRYFCLFSVFIFGFVCQANQISTHHHVSHPFSFGQIQTVRLEVFMAQQLLNRVRKDSQLKWLTLLQKEQMKKDAQDALKLYSKILTHIEKSREKSKIYFRMGYLYEVLNQAQKASETYQKILSQSEDFGYSKIAYKKYQSLEKRIGQDLNPFSQRVVLINRVQEPKVKSILQTESNIIKARSHVTLQEWNQSLEYFKRSCQTYTKSYPCVLEKCHQFPSTIRSFLQIVDRKANSDIVEEFHRIYLEYFPRDFLVNVRAAQMAVSAQKYEQALQVYKRYILLEKDYIHRNIKILSEKKLRLKNLELVFYLMQETARLSQNDDLKIQAYDFYFSQSLVREFESEMAYLKSVALFNLGSYESVAPVFRQISISKEFEDSIREQSALYALRSLRYLKQAHTAQKWGVQFVSLFPHRKLDFQKIIPHL